MLSMKRDAAITRHLVLLGGENLSAAGEGLWIEIAALLPGEERHVFLLPAASYGFKPSKYDYRLNRLIERLEVLGFSVERVMTPLISPADRSLADPFASRSGVAGIILTMGESARFIESLNGTPLWQDILERYLYGWPLIASPGAAVSLGQHAFQPLRTRPGIPPHFEPLPGLDILTECAILPQVDKLDPAVLSALARVFPAGTRLVCIPERAALFIQDDIATTRGDGVIEIRLADRLLRSLPAGTSLPWEELLA